MIIAGHGRVEAAKALGVSEVPTIVAKGWTEAQKRAYMLADNQLGLNAGWDENLLRIEIDAIKGMDFDIGLVGFGDEFLSGLFATTEGKTDPDEVPDVPETPVTKLGDVWLLGDHRIVCGDSTDAATVAKCLNGEKPHLMVTDPPYGVEYDASWREKAGINMSTAAIGKVMNDDNPDWTAAWALFPGDVAYVWHAGLFAGVVGASLEATGFSIRSQIVWAKQQMVISRGDYHWQHEPCWYVVKKGGNGHWCGGRDKTTVWNIKAREDKGHGHSTQKPVECMKRPIENNSKPSDRVYEPFSDSGTTIIAGEMTGRKVHSVELSPAYVDVAVKRWQEFPGKTATRESDGLTFAEASE